MRLSCVGARQVPWSASAPKPWAAQTDRCHMTRTTRRNFLKYAGAALALPMPALAQGSGPRVVVIGGGFGGTACARALKKANPKIAVALVETNATYSACPMANAVLGGIRELFVQQFGYSRVAATGVTVNNQAATDIDGAART